MIGSRRDRPPIDPAIPPAADCFPVADRWYRPPGIDFQAGTSGTVNQGAGRLWVVPFTNRLPLLVKQIACDLATNAGEDKYVRLLIYEMLATGMPGPVRWQSSDIPQALTGPLSAAFRVYLEPRTWGLALVTDSASGTFTALDKNDLRRLGCESITASTAACHIRYATSFVGLAGTNLSYPSSPAFRVQVPPLVALKAEIVHPGR